MISIIIPAHNEENSIQQVIDKLISAMSKVNFPYEIIVVDDGSTDSTKSAIRPNANVKIIQREKKLGYGAAVKLGFRESIGEIFIFVDGDDTYSVEEMPTLINIFIEQSCDMVVGARVHKNKSFFSVRLSMVTLLKKLTEFLTESEIPDLNSGLRIIKRDCFKRYLGILPNGFSLTSTLTMSAIFDNLKIKFVPVNYYARANGKSKIAPLKDLLNFLRLIIRSCLMFDPLKIFLPICISLFLITGIKIITDLWFVGKITGTTLFLGIGAFNLLALGLLADLIVNIHHKN